MTSDGDSLSSSPVEKFACIAVDVGSGVLEWYAFDVSDDAEHNQPLPPPLPAPYCYHYVHLTHFHLDDECGAVNLKPKATRSKESGTGSEWAILGDSLETETKTLYLIRKYRAMKHGRWVPYSGNRLERIDLISSSPTTSPPDAEETWKPVPSPMLNRVYSVPTVVLEGKLYCLGGVLETEEQRRRWKGKKGKGEEEEQPWAMVYDPNLNKWEALPDYFDHYHLATHLQPQLGHLGGGGGGGEDHLCLFWASDLPPQNENQNSPSDTNGISRLHCMKFKVVNAGNFCPKRGFVPLEVSILSCQSYLVGGIKNFRGAVVV